VSTLTAHFDLPLTATSPSWARHAVAAVLGGWGLRDQDWLDAAMTVVSELVSNAIRHGGGKIVVDIESTGRRAIVSVADGSPVVPQPRPPDQAGGLGLKIIDALSHGWYVQSDERGKRVRAELLPCPGGEATAGGTDRTEPL
jgi:anti-sigma regulatory factor (Ser/Thr protein kinase)